MIKYITEVDFDRFNAEYDNDYYLGDDWQERVLESDILGATLLSEDFYEEHKEAVPPLDNYWWLQLSYLYSTVSAAFVDPDGESYETSETDDETICVRPALILNPQSHYIQVGKDFNIGKYKFKAITEDYAICYDSIGYCCFRKNSQARDAEKYEKSDVKKFIDKWFNSRYIRNNLGN